MVIISPIQFNEVIQLKGISNNNQQTNSLIFNTSNPIDESFQNGLPERIKDPNDKRPDVSDKMWGWMNGQYGDIKEGTLKTDGNATKFVAYEDTEDGFEEIYVTVFKSPNGKVTISENRFGQGNVVVYHEVDAASGKLISKSWKGFDRKMVYNKDGSVETQKSLVGTLLDKYKDIKEPTYAK